MKLRDLVGKQVGFVQINDPIVHHNNSYECAAWWQNETSDLGVYPLTLEHAEYLYPDRPNFMVKAKIPGKITDDYFPALWGGVRVSNEPYKPQKIGNPCSVIVSADLVKAIDNTGISPGCKIDWYVNPDIWKLVIENREEELVSYYKQLPHWWDDYQQGDNEFHSKVGMVGHMAEYLVKFSREIQVLYRQQGYLEESEYWRNLHKQNTSWIEKVK